MAVKAIALINSMAGAIGPGGRDRLRRALAKVGLSHADIQELDRSNSKQQLETIAAASPDLVIAWGGDGTHRSVLETLGQRMSQLVLLPGGTMNLLPKWLHGEKPWEEVLWSVLASPRPRLLSAGKVDEQLFFCALLAGVPARLAEAREDLRRGDLGRALHDAGVALDSVGRTHLSGAFGEARGKADHPIPRSNLIGALVGPLANNGRMEIVRTLLPSGLSGLEQVWAGLSGAWRTRHGVQIESADVLVVEDEDGADIAAIIDGEHISAGRMIQVGFVEEAATCLVADTAPV